jgi:hypothetical protein
VGEWFTSFDDAWASFLARTEPLESFFDEFPDDPEAVLEVWLIVPPPDVKRAALRIQGVLEDVRGLRIVPHHFLHVSLQGTNAVPVEQLLDGQAFELRLPRLNCFQTAIVAEIESERFASVDAPATFLPHLSLAYVELPIDAADVREVLVPLRDHTLGAFAVDELVRVRVPAGRTTVLEPWAVVGRLPLRR